MVVYGPVYNGEFPVVFSVNVIVINLARFRVGFGHGDVFAAENGNDAEFLVVFVHGVIVSVVAAETRSACERCENFFAHRGCSVGFSARFADGFFVCFADGFFAGTDRFGGLILACRKSATERKRDDQCKDKGNDFLHKNSSYVHTLNITSL